MVPALLEAQRLLQRAVDTNDHVECQSALDAWRVKANNIRTLLRKREERTDLIERLSEAVLLVPDAREALNDQRRAARNSTIRVRDHIQRACDLADEIVTEKTAFAEEEDTA